MTIYLASQSPRRKELLQLMEVAFEVLLVDTPEVLITGETPEAYSQRVTTEKLQAAAQKMAEDNLPIMPILCADTEVVLDGKIMGKPRDKHEAYRMLKAYSGRSHEVLTTVGMMHDHYQKLVSQTTRVTFGIIPDTAIEHYLASGDYKDKAGAYGIQSYIGQFICRIEGCFYAVRGLPLHTVRELLSDLESSGLSKEGTQGIK